MGHLEYPEILYRRYVIRHSRITILIFQNWGTNFLQNSMKYNHSYP